MSASTALCQCFRQVDQETGEDLKPRGKKDDDDDDNEASNPMRKRQKEDLLQ